MAENREPGGRRIGRWPAAGVALAGLAALVLVAGTVTFELSAGAHASPSGTAAASEVAVVTATPSPAASPTPEPTLPPPTPVLVSDPLTGVLVSPADALRHPIAVMIDDHNGAKPQAGFNSASIVFQAPAEGGIPRYMLVFQDKVPAAVGPIRSARQYYIEWASQWNAMYVHFGGSFQALDTLRATGHSLVWNADGFRWSPTYMWRVQFRVAPHNVYTDGSHLEALAAKIGVPNTQLPSTWTFAPTDPTVRAVGNSISVTYPYPETIVSRYDPTRNAYLRYINGSKTPQIDPADGRPVAPTNVVVIRMHFGPLLPNDPHHRLEAADVGHGDAWISTGGTTIHGTWRKASVTAPLQLFDASGNPAVLQPGQTFVEVLALDYSYKIVQGKLPAPTPLPSGSPQPSATPTPT